MRSLAVLKAANLADKVRGGAQSICDGIADLPVVDFTFDLICMIPDSIS
jgi:hypothetical protein